MELRDVYAGNLTLARFHCLFCHGYEEKNVASAGVLAIGDMSNPHVALHMARMAKRLTPNVTIYTDSKEDLAQQMAQLAVNDDMKVESRRITLLKKGAEGSSVMMHFENGDVITEGFLVSLIRLHSSLPDLGHGVLIDSIGPQTQD